jgi:peptidyl-prolyl cis-trans isomerase C
MFCCTSDTTEQGKTLARINDRHLALDEFQYQLAAEMEFDKDLKLTKQVKRKFLEELIRKEVLIQEAKKRQLDRQPKFVRAIELYWEATLIRDLMELKGNQISKKALVSQAEIEAAYTDMQTSDDRLPPLSKLRDKLVEDIKEKKKTKMLKSWIDDLRGSSSVQINEELLYKD